MFQTDFYILFDHIKVQSANSISGPLSYGFPALTGLTGAVHALNRKLTHHPVQFGGVMVRVMIMNYKPIKTRHFRTALLNKHAIR